MSCKASCDHSSRTCSPAAQGGERYFVIDYIASLDRGDAFGDSLYLPFLKRKHLFNSLLQVKGGRLPRRTSQMIKSFSKVFRDLD